MILICGCKKKHERNKERFAKSKGNSFALWKIHEGEICALGFFFFSVFVSITIRTMYHKGKNGVQISVIVSSFRCISSFFGCYFAFLLFRFCIAFLRREREILSGAYGQRGQY